MSRHQSPGAWPPYDEDPEDQEDDTDSQGAQGGSNQDSQDGQDGQDGQDTTEDRDEFGDEFSDSGGLGPLPTDWRRRVTAEDSGGHRRQRIDRERHARGRMHSYHLSEQETSVLSPYERGVPPEDTLPRGASGSHIVPPIMGPVMGPVVDDLTQPGGRKHRAGHDDHEPTPKPDLGKYSVLPSWHRFDPAPPTPPFGVQNGDITPPTDPKLRAIWSQGPVGHAFANTGEREAGARSWQSAREEWVEQSDQQRPHRRTLNSRSLASGAASGYMDSDNITPMPAVRTSMVPHDPHSSRHRPRQQPVLPPFQGSPGYVLPASQLAMALPEQEVVGSGGIAGARLWDLRREEEESARMRHLAAPELRYDEKNLICNYMTFPFRYSPTTNLANLAGVRPTVYDKLPSRILLVLDTTPWRETIIYSLNSFRIRPHLDELENRTMRPTSMEGSGFSFFIEPDALLRFLTALAWVRLYLAPKLLAVSMNQHPDYVVPPQSLDPRHTEERRFLDYFNPVNRQATYFTSASLTDKPEWQWQSWHGRYYTYLWQQTCRLLVPQDLLTMQTATYLGTNQPPGPEGRYQRVVQHWREIEGERYPEELAWHDYRTWLADRNAVPQCVIDSRLDHIRGDWSIRSFNDYRTWTESLVRSLPHLQNLEANAAGSLRRNEVMLWVMEPAKLAQKERIPRDR